MNGIKKSLDRFLEGQGKNKGRKPDERYASFDFCYNHFYSFYKENKLSELADEKNIQTSCLQIGFYLASWGMLRGASFLLEKSARHYKNLVVEISKMNPKLWKIDVNNYDEENIELLIDCKNKIINALGRGNAKTWDTLVTKIMLGVFANVPAYDKFFKKFLKKNKICQTFNKKSLSQLKKFYDDDKNKKIKKELNSYKKIYTYDFLTSKKPNIYTKAKLIDMWGFVDGQ